jgi:protein-tyrosine-phosphatase
VVTVCDHADDELSPLGVEHLHWSVPDPASGGATDDFEAALDRIQPRIEHLLELTQERT